MNTTELTTATVAQAQMIPGDFAEKAMASLMQLHSELMDEKERRVDLYRKLMEREQTVAELRMYIRLLEEKVTPQRAEPFVPPPAPTPQPAARVVGVAVPPAAQPTPHARAPEVAPPMPPRVGGRKVEGWKTW
ncbi:MAG: hypothetical protein JNK82_02625 [Myxococcaceae bacterium]|nr:hypothetical protein [Myxococcaceae bacterium]